MAFVVKELPVPREFPKKLMELHTFTYVESTSIFCCAQLAILYYSSFSYYMYWIMKWFELKWFLTGIFWYRLARVNSFD